MNKQDIQTALLRDLATHIGILKNAYETSIVSVDAFQDWIFNTFEGIGVETEKFRVDSEEVKAQPAFRQTFADQRLKGKGPPNVLCRLNPSVRDGILLFAHADKHPATYEFGKQHPRLLETADRFVGPGVADDVSGISAMISALKLYLTSGVKPKKQIILASILGKQGGVFGTYGLMKRFGPLNAAVYLHPAESGAGLRELKIASNGLIEFTVTVEGKPPESTEVHQTIFAKSAVSALEKAILIHEKLQEWAAAQSETYRHPAVEAMAGQSFAVTLGRFCTGAANEVFEIPLLCTMQGTLCFPPTARLHVVREDLTSRLKQIAASDPWLAAGHWQLYFGDRIAESAESDPNSRFLTTSSEIVARWTGRKPRYFYGHSMSDIRYPLQFWKAQAYGIGPLSGDLGEKSEWVDRDEYFLTIAVLTELLHRFGG